MYYQVIVSRVMFAWMAIVTTSIVFIANEADYSKLRIGPNTSFHILGIAIDTYPKYMLVVSYCLLNSCLRTLHHMVLQPWLVNVVQDESKSKPSSLRICALEITSIVTLYTWFDWFMYMNILLSQFDMLLIETIADLITSIATTLYYLQPKCDDRNYSLVNQE